MWTKIMKTENNVDKNKCGLKPCVLKFMKTKNNSYRRVNFIKLSWIRHKASILNVYSTDMLAYTRK